MKLKIVILKGKFKEEWSSQNKKNQIKKKKMNKKYRKKPIFYMDSICKNKKTKRKKKCQMKNNKKRKIKNKVLNKNNPNQNYNKKI